MLAVRGGHAIDGRHCALLIYVLSSAHYTNGCFGENLSLAAGQKVNSCPFAQRRTATKKGKTR